jgi:hypothetical protein
MYCVEGIYRLELFNLSWWDTRLGTRVEATVARGFCLVLALPCQWEPQKARLVDVEDGATCRETWYNRGLKVSRRGCELCVAHRDVSSLAHMGGVSVVDVTLSFGSVIYNCIDQFCGRPEVNDWSTKRE